MKKNLVDTLCCPVCKNSLSIEVVEEGGDRIIEGILKCRKCGYTYSINNGIANLMPK